MNTVPEMRNYNFAQLVIENFTVPRESILSKHISFGKNGGLLGKGMKKVVFVEKMGKIVGEERKRTSEEVLEKLDELNCDVKLGVSGMAIGASKRCLYEVLKDTEGQTGICEHENLELIMPLLARTMMLEQMLNRLVDLECDENDDNSGNSENKLVKNSLEYVGYLAGIKSLTTENLLDIVQASTDVLRNTTDSEILTEYSTFASIIRNMEGTNQNLIHPVAINISNVSRDCSALKLLKQRLFDANNEYLDTSFLLQYEIGTMQVENEYMEIAQQLFVHDTIKQDGGSFIEVMSGYTQVFDDIDVTMINLCENLKKHVPEIINSFGFADLESHLNSTSSLSSPKELSVNERSVRSPIFTGALSTRADGSHLYSDEARENMKTAAKPQNLTDGGKIKKGRVPKSDEEKKVEKERKGKSDKDLKKQKLKEERAQSAFRGARKTKKTSKSKSDLLKLKNKLANL